MYESTESEQATPRAIKYGVLFLTLAILCAAYAMMHRGWSWLMLWPALSYALCAAAWLGLGPRVLGKRYVGRMRTLNSVLLLPYLLYTWSVWHIYRLVNQERAYDQLTEDVLIGRRLLGSERPDCDVVVDLTSEFPEPAALRSGEYISFPILDGFVPAATPMLDRVREVANREGIAFIHCAQGHGRTGLFAAALLLHEGSAANPDEALRLIQAKRPRARIGARQRQCLEAVFKLMQKPETH